MAKRSKRSKLHRLVDELSEEDISQVISFIKSMKELTLDLSEIKLEEIKLEEIELPKFEDLKLNLTDFLK